MYIILVLFIVIYFSTSMIISQIVAVSQNWVIGRKQGLPWSMPADAKYFHDITRHHIVIMGRKNYEANKKALSKRENIVVSRKTSFRPKDAYVCQDIQAAFQLAEELRQKNPAIPEEVFIVGGGEIYNQTLYLTDKIYITIIEAVVEGDTQYPEIDFSDYKILSKKWHPSDERNPFNWTYYILQNRKFSSKS